MHSVAVNFHLHPTSSHHEAGPVLLDLLHALRLLVQLGIGVVQLCLPGTQVFGMCSACGGLQSFRFQADHRHIAFLARADASAYAAASCFVHKILAAWANSCSSLAASSTLSCARSWMVSACTLHFMVCLEGVSGTQRECVPVSQHGSLGLILALAPVTRDKTRLQCPQAIVAGKICKTPARPPTPGARCQAKTWHFE